MSAARRVKTRTSSPRSLISPLANRRRPRFYVAAANAALAGIAAADAACCHALGERSRGDDHRDALALLRQVSPGGADAANALGRLLAIKNDAEYGLTSISQTRRESALRQAGKLVAFAEAVLQR